MLTAKEIVSQILFEKSLGGPLRDVETVGGKHHLPGGRDHQAFKEQLERDRINSETSEKAWAASQTKKPKNGKKTKQG